MGSWPIYDASDLGLQQSHFASIGSSRVHSLPDAELSPAAGLGADGAIDLGVGSPDLEPPRSAVEALVEAARRPGVHGYGRSSGIPELRQAIADRYLAQRGVELDPELEVTLLLGSKEGFAHLLWATVDEGDCVLVPNPSYPTHAGMVSGVGARPQGYLVAPGGDVVASMREALLQAPREPTALVASFPHNPTGAVVDAATMRRIVELAAERRLLVIHDFAYAEFTLDGRLPPSLLEVEGGRSAGVELYSLSKSYSMAGWRIGFAVGDEATIAALSKLKPYLDNGAFLPLQLGALHALTEHPDHPAQVDETYRERATLFCRELAAAGWPVEPAAAGMYVWAALPGGWREGSRSFAAMLAREAGVLAVPGAAFGDGGEGYVRFALVQPRERIVAAAARIAAALERQGLMP